MESMETIETIDMTGDEPISPIRPKRTRVKREHAPRQDGLGAAALQGRAEGNGHPDAPSSSWRYQALESESTVAALRAEAGLQPQRAMAPTPGPVPASHVTQSISREQCAEQAQPRRPVLPTTSPKRPYDSAGDVAWPAKAARIDHGPSPLIRGPMGGGGVQAPCAMNAHSQRSGQGRFQVLQPAPKAPHPAPPPPPPPHLQTKYPATSVQPLDGAMQWTDGQVAYRAIMLLSGHRPAGGPLNWVAWYAGRALQDVSVLYVLHWVAMQSTTPSQLAEYRRVGLEGSSKVIGSTLEQLARELLRDCPAAQVALGISPAFAISTPLGASRDAPDPRLGNMASADGDSSVATPPRVDTSLIRQAMSKTMLRRCTVDARFMQHLMRVGTGHAEFENNILILSKLERPKQNPKAEFQLCNFVEMQQQVYGRRFPRALLPGRHKPCVPRPSGTNLSTLQQLAERALISRRQQSPDAIAQALALEAAADSLFEQLLAMIANGSANDASISAFEVAVRHTYQNCDISDSTAHRDITAKTGGNDSRADAVETTTGTAASHGKREVVVGDEEISRLRTRSMRVRILQQDPSLPCLDPIITRMVDHASRDPVLAAAIQHVSGENGHLWPNQDQLLLVRQFIDAGQDQSVHHGNGSFAPRDETLPAKLLPGQWPPHITLSYRCYLNSSRRKSKMTAARSGAPLVKYSDHPDAEIDPFHDRREVPYPLSLLPKKTRHALRTDNPDGAVCSCCRRPISPSSCQRKLFLVAERLACSAGYWGLKAREQNEKALWAANYQLGIEEPVEVSSQETFFGSRLSNRNQWYPFTNREEAEMVMLVVEQAHILTNVSWAAWKSMAEKELQGQDPSRRTAGDDGGSLGPSRTVLQEKSGNIQSSPHSSASRSKSAGTPASSCPSSSSASAQPNHSAADRFDMSLPDFYRILDKVERISPMATRFLEAYAERLARESCGSCWLEENVLQEEELADVGE